MMMRIALGLMFTFLILSMLLQLNDPDRLLWMAIYGIPGCLTLLAFIKTSLIDTAWWSLSCCITLTFILCFAVLTLPLYYANQRLSWNIIVSEEGRESVGLLIVLVWLSILLLSNSSLHMRYSRWWKTGVVAFAGVPMVSWLVYRFYWQKKLDLPDHCKGTL